MTLKKDIQKEINRIMRAAWHEIDCPAHSISMGREDECTCVFSYFDEEIVKALERIASKRIKALIAEIRGELAQYNSMDGEEIKHFDSYLKTQLKENKDKYLK